MKHIEYLLPALFLVACAQQEIVVHPDNLQPLRDFGSMQVQIAGQPELTLASITDARPERGTVLGTGSSGAMGKAAPIRTSIEAGEFVRERMEKNLAQQGFKTSGDAKFKLEGQITKLSVNEVDTRAGEGVQCDFQMQLKVMDAKTNKVRYDGMISSTVDGTNSGLDATASVGPTLESCLRTATRKLIGEPQFQAVLDYRITE